MQCVLEMSVIGQYVRFRHASECISHRSTPGRCSNIYKHTQIAGNRGPFSGSRRVQHGVDRAIPSFLILMNPVSLKYGRGPPLLLVLSAGSRDSPGHGVTRYLPPFRGGGGIASMLPPPHAVIPTEKHPRVSVIGDAPLIIALIEYVAITTDF